VSGVRAFLPPADWDDASVGHRLPLAADTRHHLSRVLRLRPGDRVTLFDGVGREAEVRLASGPGSGMEAEIEALHQRPRLPGPALTLLVSSLKADKLEWVAQKATELGVDRLQPVETERAVVRPSAASARRRHERLQRIVQEAGRQCGRAWLPELGPTAPLEAALQAHRGLGIVLWEEAAVDGRLRHRLEAAGTPEAVTVLVGPEGGLSAPEIERVESHGFLRASLGPTILRAETAAIAAVALVGAHYGRLG